MTTLSFQLVCNWMKCVVIYIEWLDSIVTWLCFVVHCELMWIKAVNLVWKDILRGSDLKKWTWYGNVCWNKPKMLSKVQTLMVHISDNVSVFHNENNEKPQEIIFCHVSLVLSAPTLGLENKREKKGWGKSCSFCWYCAVSFFIFLFLLISSFLAFLSSLTFLLFPFFSLNCFHFPSSSSFD